MGDSGTAIGDDNRQQLRCRLALDRVLNSARPGVAEGIANDLGHGCGQPRLLGLIEPKQGGNLARPLPRGYNILFMLYGDVE